MCGTVGVGHSWNKELFCAGNDTTSLNIILTELPAVLDFILNPITPDKWLNESIPADFPINVDEEAGTVTVAAGLTQRQILDYLAEYTYWIESRGWTLPAYSWFLDQTIAGAVATATHGSSLRWGSLSSQVISLKAIVGNGTEIEVSENSNPHLFRALGTSVGRLGVVTELTLRIVPQTAVTRTLADLTFDEFAAEVRKVQDAYNEAKAADDWEGMQAALQPLDETQAFWTVQKSQVDRTDYIHVDAEGPDTPQITPLVQASDGPDLPVFEQESDGMVVAPEPSMADPNSTEYWGGYFYNALRGNLFPGEYPRRRAFLSMTEAGTILTSTAFPYDQYEVIVPLSIAGTCLEEVGKEIYGPEKLYEGFRTQCLVRFVKAEPFYLSPANGESHMYINMEDYISRSSGERNENFQKVVSLFREKCNARLHWGKAGWPEHAANFDGAIEYPDSWCDFGCAVGQLDPTGKFSGEVNYWRWNATSNGESISFDACCSDVGFNKDVCQCVPST